MIKNTEKFVNGLPANNVLLYGDRGTGKSSTVKAIGNEYSESGLRIIEVSKKASYGFSCNNKTGKKTESANLSFLLMIYPLKIPKRVIPF